MTRALLDTELRYWSRALEYHPERGARLGANQPWLSLEDAQTELTYRLYEAFFGGHAPSREGHRLRTDPRVSGDRAFVAALNQAANAATTWEPGWHVAQVAAGGVTVSNPWVGLVAAADDLRPAPVSGLDVSLRIPCARPGISPGFFSIVGRAGRGPGEGPLIRLYLNVTPKGALLAVCLLAALDESRGLRFTAKFVNDPASYRRRDTGVVYADPAAVEELVRELQVLRSRHRRAFRVSTPPLTLALGAGLSIAAADPPVEGRVESFGGRRCQLLAVGLLRAVVAGQPKKEWRTQVTSVFEAEGVSLCEPTLASLHLTPRIGSRPGRGLPPAP